MNPNARNMTPVQEMRQILRGLLRRGVLSTGRILQDPSKGPEIWQRYRDYKKLQDVESNPLLYGEEESKLAAINKEWLNLVRRYGADVNNAKIMGGLQNRVTALQEPSRLQRLAPSGLAQTTNEALHSTDNISALREIAEKASRGPQYQRMEELGKQVQKDLDMTPEGFENLKRRAMFSGYVRNNKATQDLAARKNRVDLTMQGGTPEITPSIKDVDTFAIQGKTVSELAAKRTLDDLRYMDRQMPSEMRVSPIPGTRFQSPEKVRELRSKGIGFENTQTMNPSTTSPHNKLGEAEPSVNEAGYRVHYYTTVGDLRIAVENRKNSYRRGTDSEGKEWSTKMKNPYGEILGTRGVDGDPVDVFIGPHKKSEFVLVVHTSKRDTDEYDEDKVILGCLNRKEAMSIFKKHYADWELHYLHDTPMTLQELKEKLKRTKNKPRKLDKEAMILVPEEALGPVMGGLLGGIGGMVGAGTAQSYAPKGKGVAGVLGGVAGGLLGGTGGHYLGAALSSDPMRKHPGVGQLVGNAVSGAALPYMASKHVGPEGALAALIIPSALGAGVDVMRDQTAEVNQTKKASISNHELHELVQDMRLDWDHNKDFMDWCEDKVGTRALSDMSPGQRDHLADYLRSGNFPRHLKKKAASDTDHALQGLLSRRPDLADKLHPLIPPATGPFGEPPVTKGELSDFLGSIGLSEPQVAHALGREMPDLSPETNEPMEEPTPPHPDPIAKSGSPRWVKKIQDLIAAGDHVGAQQLAKRVSSAGASPRYIKELGEGGDAVAHLLAGTIPGSATQPGLSVLKNTTHYPESIAELLQERRLLAQKPGAAAVFAEGSTPVNRQRVQYSPKQRMPARKEELGYQIQEYAPGKVSMDDIQNITQKNPNDWKGVSDLLPGNVGKTVDGRDVVFDARIRGARPIKNTGGVRPHYLHPEGPQDISTRSAYFDAKDITKGRDVQDALQDIQTKSASPSNPAAASTLALQDMVSYQAMSQGMNPESMRFQQFAGNTIGETDISRMSEGELKDLYAVLATKQAHVKVSKAHQTLAVDFDYTLWDKDTQKPVKGAKDAMERFRDAGWKLVIFSVRGDREYIKDKLEEHDIPYDHVNENPDQPEGSSGKVIATHYIDDRAIPFNGDWEKTTNEVLGGIDHWKEAYAGQGEGDQLVADTDTSQRNVYEDGFCPICGGAIESMNQGTGRHATAHCSNAHTFMRKDMGGVRGAGSEYARKEELRLRWRTPEPNKEAIQRDRDRYEVSILHKEAAVGDEEDGCFDM